ncbi:MAG: hypothetical protein NDI84_04150, partial [Steroidobacteraceae bacterium]|nr:hypothetical protein [Steroidobacteraceae bacterium]
MRSASSSGAPGTSGAAVVVAIVLAWTAPIAAAQVPPILTIEDASVTEGNAGTTVLTLRYALNQPTSTPVTGFVEVTPLTGAAFRPAIGGIACGGPGVDYVRLGGLLLLMQPDQANPPQGAVSITVCGDVFAEPDEHLWVRLGGIQGAQCFEGTCDGIGTIRNDGDTTPLPPSTFAVSDAAVTEPATGTKSVSFTVSLGSANPNRVEVDYRTIDGTARSTGPGTGPWTCPLIDYLGKTGRLVFQSGEVSKTVTTSICGGDSTSESNETFTLRLANPVGTTIADSSGTATIRNFKLG